jgi:hypothetical protein
MTSEFALPQGLLQRIQSEYEEQPGLRLTPPQAQRLWAWTVRPAAQCLLC